MNLWIKQRTLLMVRALYFCMEEQWGEVGKLHEISPAQQHILFLLAVNRNELAPSKIAELGCWHTSTVSRLLKPLEKKGFITIRLDKAKPKFKLVSMTREGERLLEDILETVKVRREFPLDISHVSGREILSFLEIGQRILEAHKGVDFSKQVINAKMKDVDYG